MPARSILSRIVSLLKPSGREDAPVRPGRADAAARPGRTDASASVDDIATVEIDPPRSLTLTYTPSMDGDPDAGEVVWTWVPYSERDGRGKDRPVLVIGRQSAQRVLAVRLTSKSHDGDGEYLAIGAGPWDSLGRPSWVDVDRLYSVHERGMRREACALDLARFRTVAAALRERWGWTFVG